MNKVPPLFTVTGVLVLPRANEFPIHRSPPLIVTGPTKLFEEASITSPPPFLIRPMLFVPPLLRTVALIFKSGEKLWPLLVIVTVL